MSAGNRGDEGRGKNVAGTDTGFFGDAKLLNDRGHGGDSGEDNNKRNDDSKSGLERNTPELVIINFGLLGFLET